MIKDKPGTVPAVVCSSGWPKRKGWVQTGDQVGFVVLSRDMSQLKQRGSSRRRGHTWAQVSPAPGAPCRTCPQLLRDHRGCPASSCFTAAQPPDVTISAVLINLEEKAISRLGWRLTLFPASFVNFRGCFSATTVTSSGQLDFSGKRTSHRQS